MLSRMLQVIFVLVFVFLYQPAQAQEQVFDPTVQNTILVCIAPQDPSVGEPYLLVFRNASALGIIVPDNSNVIIYSAFPLWAAEYTITSDAVSGGYRPDTYIATVSAENNIPSPRLCGNYEGYITSDLRSTIPLPVSANHAVLIQQRGNDKLANPQFLGSFAFQFQPVNNQFAARFQVIQLDGGNIDVNLPFYNEQVPYVLIANKNVSVRRSFADAPDDFSSRSFANDRSDFVRELALDNLNLFDIMRNDLVRLYPLQGIQAEYAPGGYIRIEMAPEPASRQPEFAIGTTIRSIDDDTIDYIAFAEPTVGGSLRSNELPQVLRIESQGQFAGQLIVRYADGAEIVVESWLVEVCTSDC
jgi:hypothetical protein